MLGRGVQRFLRKREPAKLMRSPTQSMEISFLLHRYTKLIQRVLYGPLLLGHGQLVSRRRLLTSARILVFLSLLLSIPFNKHSKLIMKTPRRTWSFLMDHDEDVVAYWFVSDWGLRDDLCICLFRACKELISHLSTPVEDEVLSSLSNVKVVRRAYQSLGQSILSRGELLKRHEQLNRDHVDLCKHNETRLTELNRLRNDLQREMQTNDGLSKKLVQLENAHSLHSSVEYQKSLVIPIGLYFTADWLGGLGLGRKKEEIDAMLANTSDLDIESKVWKDKHREIFTKQYPYV
nr:hypothetical protein [Tanacetum cinerariifolium]